MARTNTGYTNELLFISDNSPLVCGYHVLNCKHTHTAELNKWPFFDYVQTYPIIPQTSAWKVVTKAFNYSIHRIG